MPHEFPPPQLSRKPEKVADYFRGIGRKALISALMYGLSAAVPPVGAVVIPMYTAANYSRLGYNLYKAYQEARAGRPLDTNRIEVAAELGGELASERTTKPIGLALASAALESGAFAGFQGATGVHKYVLADMVRGSTNSALSAGGGELLKFAIAKAVGA